MYVVWFQLKSFLASEIVKDNFSRYVFQTTQDADYFWNLILPIKIPIKNPHPISFSYSHFFQFSIYTSFY